MPTPEARQAVLEQTLEQKVGELLKTTARIAKKDERHRWIVVGVILLVIVLGGLASLQAQFYMAREKRDQDLMSRCAQRNAQQASVAEFARQMSNIEANNGFVDQETRTARIRAYDVLADAYGEPLDCSIYH